MLTLLISCNFLVQLIYGSEPLTPTLWVETAQSNSCLEAVHADVDALAGVMKENGVSLGLVALYQIGRHA